MSSTTRYITSMVLAPVLESIIILSVVWPWHARACPKGQSGTLGKLWCYLGSSWILWKALHSKTFVELSRSINTHFKSQLVYWNVMTMRSFHWGRILIASSFEKVIVGFYSLPEVLVSLAGAMLTITPVEHALYGKS